MPSSTDKVPDVVIELTGFVNMFQRETPCHLRNKKKDFSEFQIHMFSNPWEKNEIQWEWEQEWSKEIELANGRSPFLEHKSERFKDPWE